MLTRKSIGVVSTKVNTELIHAEFLCQQCYLLLCDRMIEMVLLKSFVTFSNKKGQCHMASIRIKPKILRRSSQYCFYFK